MCVCVCVDSDRRLVSKGGRAGWCTDLECCGSRQAHQRHGTKADLDHVELVIVWPEIMTPLATAVRLINYDALEPVEAMRLLQL